MHFKNGVKYADDGKAYRLLKTRPVASRSGTGATYAVNFWADGSRSCNCVGWVLGAKRELKGDPRCKHLALADAPDDVSRRSVKAAAQRDSAWNPRIMLLPLRSAAEARAALVNAPLSRRPALSPEPPVKPTRRLIGEEDD